MLMQGNRKKVGLAWGTLGNTALGLGYIFASLKLGHMPDTMFLLAIAGTQTGMNAGFNWANVLEHRAKQPLVDSHKVSG